MTKRAYDPDLESMISMLPTEMDFSSPEKIQAVRNDREGLFAQGPPDRKDVTKEDRAVPRAPKGHRRADPDLPPDCSRRGPAARASSRFTVAGSCSAASR